MKDRDPNDREDVIKTMTLDVLQSSSNMPRTAREAKTMALDVATMTPAESSGGPTPPGIDTTHSVELTFEPETPTRPTAPTWFGAPPILVVMNAAILMFALVILLRSL